MFFDNYERCMRPEGRDFDIKLNENNFNGHTEPRLRTLAKNKHKKANIALEERYI